MMQPNQNFLTYFPEVELPDDRFNSDRSSCLRIGGHIVIDRIFEEYGIPQLLNKQFNAKEAGLFRDLVAYSIITESNVGQYYPDYAYNHSLF